MSKNGWLDVKMVKPECKRDPEALGTAVLIWPRNPQDERQPDVDGFAYYGRRATGKPAFYLYGAEIHGVTHWQPLPKGPNVQDQGPRSGPAESPG